jgi:hypothetical protein
LDETDSESLFTWFSAESSPATPILPAANSLQNRRLLGVEVAPANGQAANGGDGQAPSGVWETSSTPAPAGGGVQQRCPSPGLRRLSPARIVRALKQDCSRRQQSPSPERSSLSEFGRSERARLRPTSHVGPAAVPPPDSPTVAGQLEAEIPTTPQGLRGESPDRRPAMYSRVNRAFAHALFSNSETSLTVARPAGFHVPSVAAALASSAVRQSAAAAAAGGGAEEDDGVVGDDGPPDPPSRIRGGVPTGRGWTSLGGRRVPDRRRPRVRTKELRFCAAVSGGQSV